MNDMPTNLSDQSITHTIPQPPPNIDDNYVIMWNKLFQPYPWVWQDQMAYNLAVVWIQNVIMNDRSWKIADTNKMIVVNSVGNLMSHPILKHLGQFTAAIIRSQTEFENRVITLAPKFSRNDESYAWRNIPGISRGKGSLDVINDQSSDAEIVEVNPRRGLLLGGRK